MLPIRVGGALGGDAAAVKAAFEAATKGAFGAKLKISNVLAYVGTLGRAKPVTVERVLKYLQSSGHVFKEAGVLTARVDRVAPGLSDLILRGPTGGGYFAREALQHELLHVAQYLRNPAIRDVGKLRYIHELIPSYVGSPTLYIPPTVATGAALKKAAEVVAEYIEVTSDDGR